MSFNFQFLSARVLAGEQLLGEQLLTLLPSVRDSQGRSLRRM